MKTTRSTLAGLAAGVILCWLMTLLLPVGHTLWAETLSVSGPVQVTAGPPTESPTSTTTPTETPTPTATPTETPTEAASGQAGTSLEATHTAAGYADGPTQGVRGQVCVTNSGDRPTEGLAISLAVEYRAGPGQFGAVPEAQLQLVPEAPLPPGAQACFDYELPFTPLPEAKYRSAASVTISNHSGWLPGGHHCPGSGPCPFGPTPLADFGLPPAATGQPDLPRDPGKPPATFEPTNLPVTALAP